MIVFEFLSTPHKCEKNCAKWCINIAICILTLVNFSQSHAQNINYSSSPLHKDLSNIANKIDQNTNAVKATATTTAVMSGLRSLGDVIQNEKFKNASEEILKEGEWNIYQANTGLGALTLVYGKGKFAVLINNPSGQLVGSYDETSPGVMNKGRMIIDLNSKTFKTNPIFGAGENVTLRLIDSSEKQQ